MFSDELIQDIFFNYDTLFSKTCYNDEKFSTRS